MQAALLGELRGATDPTQTNAADIDEMLAARGAFGSLSARLADWEAQQYVQPYVIRNGLLLGNLLANDSFLMWSRGDAAAPDYWSLSGTGAAVARCGVGQADTHVLENQDSFSAKLTYGSAAAVLRQEIMSTAALSRTRAVSARNVPIDAAGNAVPGYSGDSALYGYGICHVWANASGKALVRVNANGTPYDSPFHPGTSVGDGEFDTLIAGPADGLGTRTGLELRMEGSGSAYFQCAGFFLSPLALPPMYIPARARYKTLKFYANDPSTGILDYFAFARHAFIVGAQMQCLTAGTVTAPTIDLLTPISGTYQSLFVTAPTIATGQLVGAAQTCDPVAANYRRRTIVPALAASATQLDNTSLRLDYVDDGGGTLRDLIVTIHYLEYDRPLDQFRAISDIGEL